MMEFSNMILVAGAGRNVGKTSLACELIRRFSSAYELVGIKISPHFHQRSHENELIHHSDHFIIYREINAESGKDSSRMLKAGAHHVYYLESSDKYIFDAFMVILPEIDYQPVICESAVLRKFVHPGIFIYIENIKVSGKNKNNDQKEKADLIVHASENSFNFNSRDVHFDGRRWTLLKSGR
jgi:hypothetical protein